MNKSIWALTLLILILLAGPAWAHAHLVSAEPPVGGSVDATDTLRLTFSEGIEIAFSKIEIAGENGKDVGAAKIARDSGNDRIVIVTLAAKLAAGKYKVHWHVVSVDTHRTDGTFTFTVTP